jgi:hypothetical protein
MNKNKRSFDQMGIFNSKKDQNFVNNFAMYFYVHLLLTLLLVLTMLSPQYKIR